VLGWSHGLGGLGASGQAGRAGALGAEVVQALDDVVVMRSPAGLDFCLVGWDGEEFRRLEVPASLPVRILVQRLGEDAGQVRAHLDLASSERQPEVARHVALGAKVEAVREEWTVLRDPAGRVYCVTDRDPATWA
jgi:Glyoxalase-like domain